MNKDNSVDIRQPLIRKCAALGIPVSGIFELTPRCNLRCKMCYVRMTPEQMVPFGQELTAQEWIQLAQEAKDAGLTFLLLTGGEPTLRADFPEIYEKITQMGLSVTVNTNGTLLTPEIRALWHKFPPAKVNVTVYGSCRADYDALCSNPDAFDRMVENLRWLKQEGILVHLNTTMAPQIAHHWLEIEQFAQQMELELRVITYCFPPVRREECGCVADFSRLPPTEAAELLVKDAIFRNGIESIKTDAGKLLCPPELDCDLGNGESIQCLAGRSQFWLGWNGRMTPCGMLTQPESWPTKEGFSAAWHTLRQKIAEIRLCPDCVNCADRLTCMNCAAVIFAETGTFTGKPEYMCQLNREYRRLIKETAEFADA